MTQEYFGIPQFYDMGFVYIHQHLDTFHFSVHNHCDMYIYLYVYMLYNYHVHNLLYHMGLKNKVFLIIIHKNNKQNQLLTCTFIAASLANFFTRTVFIRQTLNFETPNIFIKSITQVSCRASTCWYMVYHMA